MKVFYCESCHEYFDEDDLEEKEICLEHYYGVASQFDNHHYTLVSVCPYCGGHEISQASVYDLINEIDYLKKELKKWQLKSNLKKKLKSS